MSKPALLSSAAEVKQPPWLDRALAAAFLENVPDYIYFKDRDSRFIAVSMSLVRYLGGDSVYDILGKTDVDFVGEEGARTAREDEQSIIRTGESLLGKLEKTDFGDGRVAWLLTNKLPLRDAEGEIVGTFGVSKDVTPSKQMEDALEKANKDLRDASRLAGMAEVATGALHNVGNVLNSLNVSTSVIAATMRQSKMENLAKVSAMLDERAADLGHFLTADPKGKLVPEYLKSLARHSAEERVRLLKELEAVQKNIDHIKEIVALQQSHATLVGVVEPLDAAALVEDSVRMNSAGLVRHDVSVVRDFRAVPAILGERGKVLQILINLIRNAKYALDESSAGAKVMTLRIEPAAGGSAVRIQVQDNGVGIKPENLDRIFTHGFTTRATGHGFGLHSSAAAAKEMRGSLAASSDGPGAGATFTLELPVAAEAAPAVD